MSVATHLGIDLAEYDARIRTFIPHYEEMLDVAASVVNPAARTVVDLGIGTGALSQRCLLRAPKAGVIGIDSDREILKAAEQRLPKDTRFICQSFTSAELPRCDAVVGSFALHHVRTRKAKSALYLRIASALRRNGQLIVVDCYPAEDPGISREQFDAWKEHLMRSYGDKDAAGYLEAWSHEDVYVPLNAELNLMKNAGLQVEVLWRKDAFAVLLAKH
jgi:trans-aconitate methyltransferase